MPRPDHHPNFFRLFYDEAKPLRDSLPRVQCQKLLGAMALYFLFGDEPQGLPKQALALFESNRARLDRYRASALNGSKNTGKPREKTDDFSQSFQRKAHLKTEAKTDAGFQVQAGHLPATTQNLGTHLEGNPDTALGGGAGYPQQETVNSKQESVPLPPASDKLDTPESLVTYEQFREVADRLQTEGAEGMTDEDLAILYHGQAEHFSRYQQERIGG